MAMERLGYMAEQQCSGPMRTGCPARESQQSVTWTRSAVQAVVATGASVQWQDPAAAGPGQHLHWHLRGPGRQQLVHLGVHCLGGNRLLWGRQGPLQQAHSSSAASSSLRLLNPSQQDHCHGRHKDAQFD